MELDKNISHTTDKEFSCVADGLNINLLEANVRVTSSVVLHGPRKTVAMNEEVGFVRVDTVGLPVACGRSELYARACLVADLPGYRGHSPAEPRGSAECRHCTQPEKLSPRPHRLLFSTLDLSPPNHATLSISSALEGMSMSMPLSYRCNSPALPI